MAQNNHIRFSSDEVIRGKVLCGELVSSIVLLLLLPRNALITIRPLVSCKSG